MAPWTSPSKNCVPAALPTTNAPSSEFMSCWSATSAVSSRMSTSISAASRSGSLTAVEARIALSALVLIWIRVRGSAAVPWQRSETVNSPKVATVASVAPTFASIGPNRWSSVSSMKRVGPTLVWTMVVASLLAILRAIFFTCFLSWRGSKCALAGEMISAAATTPNTPRTRAGRTHPVCLLSMQILLLHFGRRLGADGSCGLTGTYQVRARRSIRIGRPPILFDERPARGVRMPGRVLIVTDVQEGFTRLGNMASPECTAAIPRIVWIVEEELAAGTPVIFTKDSHREDDREFEMFPSHCIVGTDEHDLVEELRRFEPDAAAVIQKRRYSAFFDTELERVLKDLGPDEVHICGFCTDICVLHTTSDLRNRDYRVVVRRDGCETFSAPGHDHEEVNRWALSHIERILGARVS